MRIVLDENVPLPLKTAFAATHDVASVQELGFAGAENGELIAALDGKYDVFITADKKLKYQQNLSGRSLAIVELPTNRLPLLTPLFAKISTAVESARPGDYIELAP